MENTVVKYCGEKDLFTYIQYLRLSRAVLVGAENIVKTQKDTVEKDTFGGEIKRFFSNAGKGISSSFNSYKQKSDIANQQYKFFRSKYNNGDEEAAKQAMHLMFDKDYNGTLRILFGVKIILDHEYEYEKAYEDEGLRAASQFLFNNPFSLINLKKQLMDYFDQINGHSLSSLQKKVFIGVAVASLVAAAVIPVLSIGGLAASGSATTGALAAIGFGDMQLGVGVLTVGSLLASGALIGGTYLAMSDYNKKEVRKEFKKMSASNQNMYLAIQCILLTHLKSHSSSEDFKNHLDDVLQSLSNLKADLDYFTFVEQEKTVENQRKIEGFHNFDNLLFKLI